MTNVTHVVDVHLPPASPKPLKGLTKRHRGSAESIKLAQHKQSKVSSRERSAMVAPIVSVQPPVTPSVSDRASCDEDGLSMETSDDIVTAVPPLQTIPRTSGRFTNRPVPWWNAACTNAVKHKRAAFSRLRRHRGDPQCLKAFRRCRAQGRRVLKEVQRASWKAYVSSINAHTPLTDVFSKIHRIAWKHSAPPPPVLLSAGRTVVDPRTVADLFAEHFASVSRLHVTAREWNLSA
ncbi:hypothetical protein E2C01_071112 [Portunus trituberculatus]|uniref:Uncharacterized protein n=1 Tax=Portunus trituberculatus TaxID=210409 RepID=A0A5B7I5E1_PORTR|nr:hypothetical protein [Portunus trituberculatus]